MRIVDTAGIRQNADEVEAMGIERARKQIEQADLILFMLDAARGVEEEDKQLFESVRHKPLLLLANKAVIADQQESVEQFVAECDDVPFLQISAKQHQNIDALKDTIFAIVVGSKDQWQEEGCAPNVRHKDALQRAVAAAAHLQEGLEMFTTSDLLAIDLQDCLDQLNAIVGVTTTEDVLDVIFEQFCLGK